MAYISFMPYHILFDYALSIIVRADMVKMDRCSLNTNDT